MSVMFENTNTNKTTTTATTNPGIYFKKMRLDMSSVKNEHVCLDISVL